MDRILLRIQMEQLQEQSFQRWRGCCSFGIASYWYLTLDFHIIYVQWIFSFLQKFLQHQKSRVPNLHIMRIRSYNRKKDLVGECLFQVDEWSVLWLHVRCNATAWTSIRSTRLDILQWTWWNPSHFLPWKWSIRRWFWN